MAAKVYIVIYTLYHHIYKLAVEIQKGLEASGVNVTIFQGKNSRQNCINLILFIV